MLKLKPLIAAKAKESYKSNVGRPSKSPQNSATISNVETRKELSKLAGVSHDTISRIETIAKKAPDDVKTKLRAGEMSINEAYKKVKQIEKAEKIEAEISKAKEVIESLAPMEGKYGVIVIDPPWQYEKRNNDITHRGRCPYPTMTTEELCKMKLPMNDDCIVWLWTTNAFMHESFHVLDAWGLTPKTILTWVKDRMGLGDWLRGKTEHCILAVKGKPMINLTNETTVLNASTREHSRKPDEFYELVRNLCPGKRLEIFAREKREGFDIYGAESDKF
jgi:N6-adenosine-specific RNA methylase IME4